MTQLSRLNRPNFSLKDLGGWGYFLIFGLSFVIFLYVLAPPGIKCPDSFYHTKAALMIKENGLIQSFPWTQFTTYNDLFVDHHFGYHYLLIPFLSLPTPKNLDSFSAEIDPLIKAKLGTAVFAALVFLALFWFLCRLKVKAPLFWSLTALLISPFLIRLSLTRAPSISIIILILGFYSIIKRKYPLLFVLSFFYVWVYGAWPLMLVAAVLYCLASAVKELIGQWPAIQNQTSKIKKLIFYISHPARFIFSKTNFKLVFTCVLGLFAGLIINPYFPKTLPFYWFQTIKIAILNYQNQISVGIEWYPFGPGSLFINTLPILIFWIISLAWFIYSKKEQETQSWFFLFISIFFLFYTLKAQRNIEYFIPSAMFFSALNFSQIGKKINWSQIKNRFGELFRSTENIFYFILIIFLIVLIGFFLLFYLNHSLKELRDSYANYSRPINHLQMASFWLKNNTQPGEIIFQGNWDIFPELFYFNTNNYYINGLDQTFMYEKDKGLYEIWLNLISGKTDPDKTGSIIKEKFRAGHILLDKKNKNFGRLLEKSKSLGKVYEDDEAIIYKIK